MVDFGGEVVCPATRAATSAFTDFLKVRPWPPRQQFHPLKHLVNHSLQQKPHFDPHRFMARFNLKMQVQNFFSAQPVNHNCWNGFDLNEGGNAISAFCVPCLADTQSPAKLTQLQWSKVLQTRWEIRNHVVPKNKNLLVIL